MEFLVFKPLINENYLEEFLSHWIFGIFWSGEMGRANEIYLYYMRFRGFLFSSALSCGLLNTNVCSLKVASHV